MKKLTVLLKEFGITILNSIANSIRKLTRNTIIFDNDNFNHLLFYSLNVEDFLPIFAHKLILEKNHAKNENLNAGKYFLVNLQRLSEYMKLDKQVIICILYYMEEFDFVSYISSGIENTKLISIDEDALIACFPECKQDDYLEYLQTHKQNEKYKFFNYFPKYRMKTQAVHTWDKELENKYTTKRKIPSFTDATNELRHFIDKNIKNNNRVPLSTYACFDLDFESLGVLPEDIRNKNFKERILKCINSNDFEPIKLVETIKKYCDELLVYDV